MRQPFERTSGASLPIIRPTLPDLAEVEDLIRESWSSGIVTVGPIVQMFEREVCRHTRTRHAIALSSCTAGLMLVPRALNLARGSEVVVPSFTFAATVEALVWNGIVPVFSDCVPGTCTLDPEQVERSLSARTVAICPAYVYGLPPDVEALLDIGRRHGIPVYFDSAQGLGATYRSRAAGGSGVCEVFSLSPTKVVTALEGGVVTTDDDRLAERLRSMRDYGKDPVTGEEMVDLGLSARMSEIHAAVGVLSLRRVHELVKARMHSIAVYRDRLSALPGCRVQAYPDDRQTSGNYFVLFITRYAKRTRDEVYGALKAEGIQTKRYFYPPVHEQSLFKRVPVRVSGPMTHTIEASNEALALPLYSHMTAEQLEMVCHHVERLLA